MCTGGRQTLPAREAVLSGHELHHASPHGQWQASEPAGLREPRCVANAELSAQWTSQEERQGRDADVQGS